jgi:hypothetical protein
MPDQPSDCGDTIDMEVWKRAWLRMPHRHLPDGNPKLSRRDGWPPIPPDASGWGALVACTISLDPPEYAGRMAFRPSARCPVCGRATDSDSESDRLPASLHPVWESGRTLGLGAWVHRECFDACADAGPLPWFPW